MNASLIATARHLADASQRAPTQTDLRRAVSTAYYAAFDALARLCADELAGRSPAERASAEWSRVYRALPHGRSIAALAELTSSQRTVAVASSGAGVAPRLTDFCEVLEQMRRARLNADYQPGPLSLSSAEVLSSIDEVETAIVGLALVDSSQLRMLAFACVIPRRIER